MNKNALHWSSCWKRKMILRRSKKENMWKSQKQSATYLLVWGIWVAGDLRYTIAFDGPPRSAWVYRSEPDALTFKQAIELLILETSQSYKIATITKKLVKKQFGSKRKRSGWLFLIDSYGPKYIVHLKVKSKWHEETSSNEWELGNDRTCQKNRHRPVLVRTNRVYLAGKACEGEPKSSLCLGNCLQLHGRMQH